jgi:hypothetical protein
MCCFKWWLLYLMNFLMLFDSSFRSSESMTTASVQHIDRPLFI